MNLDELNVNLNKALNEMYDLGMVDCLKSVIATFKGYEQNIFSKEHILSLLEGCLKKLGKTDETH